MTFGIRFRKKICRTLRLNISPRAEFNEILSVLNSIALAGGRVNQEHVMYAVLELVNNSLRAHRERSVNRPIHLEFTAGTQGLSVLIRDFGGGFDPKRLPFDLHAPVESVDTNDESFQKYREQYGYKRFGIGLYIAKKTFSPFRLRFFNGDGDFSEYREGITEGTHIEMTKSWSPYE